jgi:hypothetical protein
MNRSLRVGCVCALASIACAYFTQPMPAAQTSLQPTSRAIDPRDALTDDDADWAMFALDDPDANIDVDAVVDPTTASSLDYTSADVTAPFDAYERADAAWLRKIVSRPEAEDDAASEPVPIEVQASTTTATDPPGLSADAAVYPDCIEPVPSRRSPSRGFNTLQLFQFSAGDENTAIKRMVDSGSTVHRLTVYWADVQPSDPRTNPAATWNEDAWTKYHDIYDKLTNCGFQVILNPMGSPDWARVQSRQNGNPRAFPSDSSLGYWNLFVRELANRFDANRFEIWNEENSIEFWDPTPSHHPPSPTAWTNLFCRAAREIRSVRADAQVGVGGLAVNSQASRNKVPASRFLQRAYAVGLAKCQDSFVGYHPYMINAYCLNGPNPAMQNTDAISQFRKLRSSMTANGQGALDVWNTEWGFPSRTFETSATKHTVCRYNAQRQATMIRREFNYLAQLSHLRYAVYFNIRDDANAYPCGTSATGFSTIGMLPCAWMPAKPSFATWQSLP